MPIGFLPAKKVNIDHIQPTETDPRPLKPARYSKGCVCRICGAEISAEGRTAGEAENKLETQIKWHNQDNH